MRPHDFVNHIRQGVVTHFEKWAEKIVNEVCEVNEYARCDNAPAIGEA